MSKHVQIQIAEPCHENWQQMTPTEQGRFCDSCQKQVVDFSKMSDSQLASFFKKPSSGSMCGRFFSDQLDRDLEIPRKRIPWVKWFFQFALPAFLFSTRAAAQGKVKTEVKEPGVVSGHPGLMALGGISVKESRIAPVIPVKIEGMVVDENNQPIPFASVIVKGTGKGAATDSIGHFVFDKLSVKPDLILEVSRAGFAKAEFRVSELDISKPITFKLQAIQLNEVVLNSYVGIYKRSTVMGGISVIKCEVESEKVKERLETKKSEPPQPMIKVYPNPAVAGTAINIGCEWLDEGYYHFRLTSSSGQVVVQRQLWVDAEARILNIELPSLTPGSYILSLNSKATGKTVSEKIIIQ